MVSREATVFNDDEAAVAIVTLKKRFRVDSHKVAWSRFQTWDPCECTRKRLPYV